MTGFVHNRSEYNCFYFGYASSDCVSLHQPALQDWRGYDPPKRVPDPFLTPTALPPTPPLQRPKRQTLKDEIFYCDMTLAGSRIGLSLHLLILIILRYI